MTPTRTAGDARTLSGEYYTSESIYAAETEKIFLRRWLYAGRVSQLANPGDYFLFDVDDESVLVVREEQGQIRAFYNVCRHRGTRLCTEEAGRFSRSIQCRYHGWRYGLDGNLQGAPNMRETGGFDKSEFSLHRAHIEIWEGSVFINLSRAPRPFEEAFAPVIGKFSAWRMPELISVHRIVYDVEANWKLILQNYSECYHCPTLHPLLNRLTHYRDSSNDIDEGPILGGSMRLVDGKASMSLDGGASGPPLPGVKGDDLCRVYYYSIFPGMLLSLAPDYVMIHRILRRGPRRSRIICEWLFHPDAVEQPGFDASGAIKFWDMTNRQDWQVCQLSQQGVASRVYSPGPYSDLESVLAAFDREYLRSLREE